MPFVTVKTKHHIGEPCNSIAKKSIEVVRTGSVTAAITVNSDMPGRGLIMNTYIHT